MDAKVQFEPGVTIRSSREAAAMPFQAQGPVPPSSRERMSMCRVIIAQLLAEA
jgi:hypothetical protein